MDRRRMIVVFLVGALVAGVAVAAMRGGLRGAPVAVLAGLFVVVCVGLIVAVRLARADGSRIRSAVDDAATEHGFQRHPDADPKLHRSFGRLPGIPRSGKVSKVLVGSIAERSLTVFQHTYVVNTGQAVIPVHHVVYACDAPRWPEMIIVKRGVLSRIGRVLGRRDDLVLEHEPFNASRRVRTDDEEFAIMLLGPEMQEFLTDRPDIAWRIGDARVAMIYSGALRLDRMGASLARLHRFWDLVPPELEAAFAGPPVAAYPSPSHG